MSKPKATAKKSAPAIEIADYYYSDCREPDMLYAAVIRSTCASGTITDIALPVLPDGTRCITARDIPGAPELTVDTVLLPIFSRDVVHYRGEPLGLIVAPDEKTIAAVLAETTDVCESPSPADAAGQIAAERTIATGVFASAHNEAAIEAVFSAAAVTVSCTTELHDEQPYWTEPNGAFCSIENDNITVYAPTQDPKSLRSAVAAVLALPEEHITIKRTKISPQSVNGLWQTHVLAVQVALAAYITKRPVLLVLSHEEQTVFMRPGPTAQFICRAAVDADGHMQALAITITADSGGWNPAAATMVDRYVLAASSMYCPKSVLIHAVARLSHSPPFASSARMFDRQAFFAIERLIDHIARAVHRLPSEVRLANLERQGILPFSVKTGAYGELYTKLIHQTTFNRKHASFETERAHRKISETALLALPLRGIGMAGAFDGSDCLHHSSLPLTLTCTVTRTADGSVTVQAPETDQEIMVLWNTVVENELGVPRQRIHRVPFENPERLSVLPTASCGAVSMMTEILRKCCCDIQKKQARGDTLPLQSTKTLVTAVKKQWDAAAFCGNPYYTATAAGTIVELHVNPYTYEMTITGIWMLIDCGEVISVPAAERAIRRAIQQELACLIAREALPCETLSISFIQSDAPPSPIGDIVHNTVPAAFCAALSQAIGAPVDRIPCTIESIAELHMQKESDI
ncbi:MAG: xanthine dehydrogenase family protein molybdopterin-binding subunit [Treponema sp.]|nr:xanthine dehydrogenase family protein molybdopterin-binding subunit [Treponema sp.]